MAVGDVKADLQAVTAGTPWDIRGAVGEEFAINNLYYGGAVEFWRTNGTIAFKYDSDAAAGTLLGVALRVTNGQWLQIRSVSGTVNCAFDGVVTK